MASFNMKCDFCSGKPITTESFLEVAKKGTYILKEANITGDNEISWKFRIAIKEKEEERKPIVFTDSRGQYIETKEHRMYLVKK